MTLTLGSILHSAGIDPATPERSINEAESHFKTALDTRRHGLNRN